VDTRRTQLTDVVRTETPDRTVVPARARVIAAGRHLDPAAERAHARRRRPASRVSQSQATTLVVAPAIERTLQHGAAVVDARVDHHLAVAGVGTAGASARRSAPRTSTAAAPAGGRHGAGQRARTAG